ncbi:MAG TPA: ABC transporter substrate-binding protein [Kofleriaceae bacterium]
MRRCGLALAAIALAAGVAHAEGRPHYGGIVDGALLGEPVTFDPPAAQSHAEVTLVGLVFDTLYSVGPDGNPIAHLALDAPSGEGTKVRIKIRKGVKFHDGSEMTSADVAASLERVRTSGSRWALAPVASVKASGDSIEITLKVATPQLATLLALPVTAITKGGKAATEKSPGTGPFSIERVDAKGKKIELEAFDDHFAGRPYIDKLVLHWFDAPDGEAGRYERGEAQLSARGVAAFTAAQPKYKADAVEGPPALLVYIGFGRKHPDVTAERQFRKALDLAMVRQAVASVSSGERVSPSRLPVPVEAGAPVLDAAGKADNLPAAQAALAQAATKVKALAPANLAQLKLEILVEETRPDDREIAERVARALNKLGIDSVITGVSASTLRDRVKRGDCDLYIGQLAEPLTSGAAWWGAAFAVGGELWAEQKLATGTIATADAIKAFGDRLPIVPLAFRTVRMWHRTDVRGLNFDASGRPDLANLFYFGDAVKGTK